MDSQESTRVCAASWVLFITSYLCPLLLTPSAHSWGGEKRASGKLEPPLRGTRFPAPCSLLLTPVIKWSKRHALTPSPKVGAVQCQRAVQKRLLHTVPEDLESPRTACLGVLEHLWGCFQRGLTGRNTAPMNVGSIIPCAGLAGKNTKDQWTSLSASSGGSQSTATSLSTPWLLSG